MLICITSLNEKMNNLKTKPLKILTFPDSKLRRKSFNVRPEVNLPEIKELIGLMFNTLKFYGSKPRYGNDFETHLYDDYVEYDSSDPSGEVAYKQKMIQDTTEEIEILKEKLSKAEEKLKELIPRK